MSLTENQLEMSRRLLQALDRELRKLRRGAITELERSVLGVKDTNGWWQNRVKAGYINTAQLFAVFDFLKLDPVRFMREAVGQEDGLELHRPRGEAPEIVRRAWQRFHAGDDAFGSVKEDLLQSLDRMRYEHATKAARIAEEVVDYCPVELLPRLLGVTGSCWRLLARLDPAEHAIIAGLQIAKLQGNRAALGALFQRLAYVFWERAKPEAALTLAERATTAHLRCGNPVAVAKTLVDQGIWLNLLARQEEAIAVQEIALKWLPQEEKHNRFAAFQNIGLNYRELGKTELALRYSDQAMVEVVGLPKVEHDRAKWLRGNLRADLGELEEAVALLEEAVKGLAQAHLGDMALAACDLVRVHLSRGQPRAAFRAATVFRRLVEPLRDNKTVSTAIADLLRNGEDGLTLALAMEFQTQIEGELRRLQIRRQLMVVTTS